MRPQNPEFVTPDAGSGYRITVPARLVPSWFTGTKASPVYLVPLLWKRQLALPDGHQLEAWFVWSEDDSSQDWLTDPRSVLDPDQSSANGHHLQTLVHAASFVLSDRKHRLSCAGLLNYLVEKGGPKLWITDERNSLGIMTDFAYHTAYGRLRL
jgi:hypothetical protein